MRTSTASVGLCSSSASPSAPPKPSSLVAWCEANPWKLGVGIATVKTASADLLTQTALEGKAYKDIDWRRNVVFTLFGFGYFGCAQYYLYVNLFSRWFAGAQRFFNQPLGAKLRDFAGQRDAAKQILFDLLIHPQWVFPMYYTLKEAVGNLDAFVQSPSAVATKAVGKYWKNNFDRTNEQGLLTDWIPCWKIWVVGDIVVFAFCPMWARLPVNHIFSFMYVCVLSFMRGAAAEKG